jgi:riboflavin synthase alpha subunit
MNDRPVRARDRFRFPRWGQRGTTGASIPAELSFDVVTQIYGSVRAVDGVSLTIADLPRSSIVRISLIEYTLRHTTLGDLTIGDEAHVEGDIIGKYVQRLLGAYRAEPAATG